ncbi:glycoside hydrolase superfamily [Mrakia frigida]|uniref:glycoside hydrolase family 5 protein n=1 Tax=Mrakia frigida TaxID=29902 RepID=UPI003FCC0C09
MSATRPGYNHVDSDAPLTTPERGSPPAGHYEPSHLAASEGYRPRDLNYPSKGGMQPRTKRRLLIGSAVLLVIALAVAIPVGITQSKKGNSSALAADAPSTTTESSSSLTSSTTTASSAAPSASASQLAITGRTGSLLRLDNGDEVVYNNTFGGDWVYDPNDPVGAKTGALAGGRAQDWVPRIGETWTWGEDIIHGVNLGGWLVLEPFICPGIFEQWRASTSPGAAAIVDEYTLSAAMGANLTAAMTEHYETFITERDFMEIAAAGLNFVRIPIGFWAIETMGDETFLPRVSWTYFLKAISWARKYGIRINLDLHALPGSQNGWNHSGRVGSVGFMSGVMGIANAERTLSYLRTIAEFISQPEIKDVVPIFGIVNEILWAEIGEAPVKSFYLEALQTIRDATGTGAGNGPYIAIHDGFQGPAEFADYLPSADRLIIDSHPYLAFDPTVWPQTMAEKLLRPCGQAAGINTSLSAHGPTIGGEFSAASTDCGFWLNGIGPAGESGSQMGATVCEAWEDWQTWDAQRIADVRQVALRFMDATQNWFFWTWKIGVSTTRGYSASPDWHYQLGLEHGWIPADPREAIGLCAAQSSSTPFDGTFPPASIGAGTGAVDAADAALYPWPPATLNNIDGLVANLPRYTATGAIATLPPATVVGPTATTTIGSGWTNPTDRGLAYVPIEGCTYPE